MDLIRSRQPALTRVSPHNGNLRHIVPSRTKFYGPPELQAAPTANYTVGTPVSDYLPPKLLKQPYSKPYKWAVSGGALPAGLQLSMDGVIVGTPTTPGSGSATITASELPPLTGADSQAYAWTVT